MLSHFYNKRNRLHKTGARMLDSTFYHMALKLVSNRVLL